MFPRALRITRFWGVEIRLDPTLLAFGVLIVWTFSSRFVPAHGQPTALVMAVAGTLLFLGSILAHELAHALEARHRGMEVHGVTLFLFGGVTEMHAHGQTPRDELAVAAVGPYASLVCGALFGLAATFAGDLLPGSVAGPVGEVAGLLGWLNVALAVFNLVPGAPLDGGRVLRALLWMLLRDRTAAVRISVRAGQLLALVLVAAAAWLAVRGPDAWLPAALSAIVAVFLYGAARQELRQHTFDVLLASCTIGELVAGLTTAPATDADELPAVELDDDLHTLLDRLEGDHDHVRLEDRGVVLGTLSQRQVAQAIGELRARAHRSRSTSPRAPRRDDERPAPEPRR